MSKIEMPLSGGRTTVGVVRVGDTVRRPRCERAQFVHQLLLELAAGGFDGVPRFLGIDAQGRDVLSFLPGDVPAELGVFSPTQLGAAARLLRALHDATRASALRGNTDIVCHGDPSPCNTVFQDGLPYAWIDFDGACPGHPSEDLGYAAWLWLDIGNDECDPRTQGIRLAAFFSDYGAEPDIDPVVAVLAAQGRRRIRIDGPPGNRAWAAHCQVWTLRNRQALEMSLK